MILKNFAVCSICGKIAGSEKEGAKIYHFGCLMDKMERVRAEIRREQKHKKLLRSL